MEGWPVAKGNEESYTMGQRGVNYGSKEAIKDPQTKAV